MICCDVCKKEGAILHVSLLSDTLDKPFKFDFCIEHGSSVLYEFGDLVERLQKEYEEARSSND